jgi:nicotinate-nucleotide adenylyltransferase
MIKTGLFFGSFNPIHIGHLAIANYMVELAGLDQVWFVISPQNPLKKKNTLLADYHRLELINLAIGEHPKYKVSDIELKLPKPSYTIDTLTYIKEKHPANEFVLIMGSDGLATFNKWKNYKEIIKNYTRYIYPRPGMDPDEIKQAENVVVVEAPLIEISSTFIRQAIKEKKDIRFFLSEKVYQYIQEMHFYEK